MQSFGRKRETIEIFLITIIKIISANGIETIVDDKDGTSYNGAPEKASEYFQSQAYQTALFSAIQKANIRSYKAIQLEIKHNQI